MPVGKACLVKTSFFLQFLNERPDRIKLYLPGRPIDFVSSFDDLKPIISGRSRVRSNPVRKGTIVTDQQ